MLETTSNGASAGRWGDDCGAVTSDESGGGGGDRVEQQEVDDDGDRSSGSSSSVSDIHREREMDLVCVIWWSPVALSIRFNFVANSRFDAGRDKLGGWSSFD